MQDRQIAPSGEPTALHAAHEALRAHQARLALLARAGERLSSSLDPRVAVAELAKLVVPTLADWCAIDEVGPDGRLERLAVEHVDPEKVALAHALAKRYPPDPDARTGVHEVVRTGRTEWVPQIPPGVIEASAVDAEHLEIVRDLGLSSYAVVPIVARSGVLGALTIVTERSRRVSEDDVRICEELSRRAGLALENARLYASAEAARGELHRLFLGAPVAIAMLRGEGERIELANRPFEALAGTAALVGRRMREAAPQLDRALGDLVVRVREIGAPASAHELPVGEGGDARVVDVVCQPTCDVVGRVDGVAIFAYDVTERVAARRRAERLTADVLRSEARMRALVDATAAVVWTATAGGEVVTVSRSWLAFTGQTPEEYVDGGFADAIHPDDRERTLEAWAAAMGRGGLYAAEYRLRRADGTYAHTLARALPVRDAAGAVLEYVGCNVDVTEQRQAEAEARATAEVLATVNDLGRTISAELDRQKVVQDVTDAVTRLSGAEFGAFFYNVRDEHGGSYMLYTLSGVPRERFSRFPMPRNTAVFGPTFEGEGVVRVDDITQDPRYGHNAPYHGMPEGHLPVRSYLAVPVVSRGGEVLGGLFLGHAKPGVFDRRAEQVVVALAAQAAVAVDNARLFEDAQRLIRALEQTNRDLDQFAYAASHDLKAPLRGIGSLAEWIEEDLGAAVTPDVRRKLELLRGRVHRMDALIAGILAFSRAGRGGGERGDVDVGALLADVTDLLSPEPPARVEVAPGMPTVFTERVALQQVFLNLVGNALKHAGKPDVRVRISATRAGPAWEFRVSDDGPGIASEFHERVWGIFQTLAPRDQVESTGIGLAIVKRIVESRGGRVWIESRDGGGATFGFTWPARDERRIG